MVDSWWTPFFTKAKQLRPIQLTRLLGGLLTTLLARLLAMEHAESETRETAIGQGTGHAETFCWRMRLFQKVMNRIRRSFFFCQICGWSQYVTVSHGTFLALVMVQVLPASSMPPASPQERDRAGEHNETTTSETPNSGPPQRCSSKSL